LTTSHSSTALSDSGANPEDGNVAAALFRLTSPNASDPIGRRLTTLTMVRRHQLAEWVRAAYSRDT